MVSGQGLYPAERSGAGFVVVVWSGGGFEGDAVAQCFELVDVVAFLAVVADAGVVEAGAEVWTPTGSVDSRSVV